jgi:hypothetical protein
MLGQASHLCSLGEGLGIHVIEEHLLSVVVSVDDLDAIGFELVDGDCSI